MLNHSCRPTAHHAFRLAQGQPPTLVFRSLHALAPGQELCYSYTDLLHPAPLRRAKLAAAYFFDCGCGRCGAWDGAGGEEEEDGSKVADRLIERALASPACAASDDCPGVLIPVDDDEKGNGNCDLLRCSACGEEEAAAEAESRVAMGTALLEARLRALNEEQQQQQQQQQEEEEEGDRELPDAVRALADMLLGREEGDEGAEQEAPQLLEVGLHPQHWLVTQALLALCPRLAELQPPDGGGSSSSSSSRKAKWMHAAAEAWALQILWLVAGAMTGPGPNDEGGAAAAAGKAVGRFTELGKRLVATGRALRALHNVEKGAALLSVALDVDAGGGGGRGKRVGGMLARARRAFVGGGALADRLAPLRELEGIGGLEERGRSILLDG